MCDRSADPSQHDAARERPSALDVERLVDAIEPVLAEKLGDLEGVGPFTRDSVAEAIAIRILARLTEPDAGEGTEPRPQLASDGLPFVGPIYATAERPEPDAGEGTTLDDAMRTYRTHVEAYEATRNPAFREDARRAIGFDYSGPDTTEATPLPSDAGPYYGPVVRTTPWRDVRVDHAEHTHATPDTTEATLRALLDQVATRLDSFCDHCGGSRRMLTNAVDLPMDEREEDCLDSIHAAADQVRAALQQPAVQPEPCGLPVNAVPDPYMGGALEADGSCGLRRGHHGECAVQPEGGPE